jgi:hypothetical protein
LRPEQSHPSFDPATRLLCVTLIDFDELMTTMTTMSMRMPAG